MISKLVRDKYMFVCLFFGTILLHDYGVESELISNVRTTLASTFLSVGIIGLIIDYMMRDQLKSEMIRLVGIQSSIMSNRIEGAGSQEDMRWDEFFRTGTNFKFILSDAENWLAENWSRLEHRSKDVPIQVEIYIPNPRSDYLSDLSARNGHSGDTLSRACEAVRERIETLWKSMAVKPDTRQESKISIIYLSIMPSYSVVSSDSITHLLITPPVSKNLARLPFRLSFRASVGVEPVANFLHRVNPTDAGELAYENVVKK